MKSSTPYYISAIVLALSGGILPAIADYDPRPTPRDRSQALTTEDLITWPRDCDTLPAGVCDVIKLSIPGDIPGKIFLNVAPGTDELHTVRLRRLHSQETAEPIPADFEETGNIGDLKNLEESDDLEGLDDPDESEESNISDYQEEIMLTPELTRDHRSMLFFIDRNLAEGRWQLEIPEGLFEIRPEYIEVNQMPFSPDTLSSLTLAGAWHKAGGSWSSVPLFSIHDDDGVDGKIPSCGSAHIPDRNGYFTILYPLLQSLGVRGNVSMEGWRCGMTANPPRLNENGQIMLRLEKEAGWEMQAHSMEVLGDRNNNWLVDGIDSPLAQKILKEANGRGEGNTITSIYDDSTGVQYYPSADGTHWDSVSTPRKIKPYALEYPSGRPIMYIKEHDVDYHWGEWFRLAKEWGFKAQSWVQHNSITSHDYARLILQYGPNGFSDMVPPHQYNLPPLRSTATRMLLEGQSAPGYIGESSDDNTYDPKQYRWFCDYIDRCVADGGWMVLGLHAYRKCWKNSLPGALVSEGGDYPDEWVDPLAGMDYLHDDLATPPARLGIKNWSEWYPCPGTRLDMVRDIILYCLEHGMENVTSSEGFERMGNRRAAGYFNDGVRCGYDRFMLRDDRDRYPHYLESATGEEFYYAPLCNERLTREFTITKPDIITGVTTTLYRGPVRYFDMWGREISGRDLRSGVYIRLDASGAQKIVR